MCVTEADVEDIVKMGVSGEAARAMVEGGETPASFLGEGSSLSVPTAMRTPRVVTEQGGDVLKTMARNLKAMTDSQTPLFGGDIPLEGSMDFAATPQRAVAATPNALMQGATPRVGATPRGPVLGKTPARDAMGINTPHHSSGFEETPRGQPTMFRQQLSSLFSALPKPKNDFEIVLPDVDDDEGRQDADRVEDSEVVKARQEAERQAELERKLKLRSQAVQRSLPRPAVSLSLLSSMYRDDEALSVEELISNEKAVLLYNDAVKYPLPGQEALGSFYPMDKLDDHLEQATLLIQEEVHKLKLKPLVKGPVLFQDYELDLIHHTTIAPNKMTDSHYQAQHKALFQQMKEEAAATQKLEKKLSITLGGYMMRNKVLTTTFETTVKELAAMRSDVRVFAELAQREQELIQVRLADESRELQRLAMMEQDLQDRYQDLTFELDELSR
ncbi:Pre-mRNA-splicing factor cef1 [Kappamyces sp. JEL0680]|nr:Pre-mRNA-splicing factor cef1 [Kappamyces sp. JEL0680]